MFRLGFDIVDADSIDQQRDIFVTRELQGFDLDRGGIIDGGHIQLNAGGLADQNIAVLVRFLHEIKNLITAMKVCVGCIDKGSGGRIKL